MSRLTQAPHQRERFLDAILLLAVAAVVAAAMLGAAASRRRFEKAPERGDSYPTGSRPARPGAEGMRVDDPGEITPGPRHNPDEDDRPG